MSQKGASVSGSVEQRTEKSRIARISQIQKSSEQLPASSASLGAFRSRQGNQILLKLRA
jgi:hypothetical protein